MEKGLKTGTTTVGIVCKDGVVLGSDMRATAGNMIANKRTRKIHKISDDMAVTWAGSVSDLQLINKLIRAEIKLKSLQTKRKVTVKEAANLLGGLLYSNIRQLTMLPAITHFILGGRDNRGYHLYDLYPDGSVEKMKDFSSSGSGSVFALGVLEIEYKPNMNVEQGIELASKAVRTALERDTGSGGGVLVYTITDKGVEERIDKKIINKLED
ncbi:proteasome subunit beta [Candidatus Woesearchaeota archaeon]|nr:proteasome subunit beta [Candidatus Woesearchaeota archaeon]